MSTNTDSSKAIHPPGRTPHFPSLLVAVGLLMTSGLVLAQPASTSCFEVGKNMQCNEFGTVSMDSQRDIRGDVISVTATITLNTNFADRGARWILFSARNATTDANNPVQIEVTRFETTFGAVPTSRVENDLPYERNMWVHVVDLPIATPITLTMDVGATERGAFRVETLVMAFDRGYAPIVDSTGAEASLFSFTLLGVNKETGSVASSSNGQAGSSAAPRATPAPGALVLVSILAFAAVATARFRRR